MCGEIKERCGNDFKKNYKFPFSVNTENWKIEKIPPKMPECYEYKFVSKFTYNSSKQIVKLKTIAETVV